VRVMADSTNAFSLAQERPAGLVLANAMILRLDGFDLLREARRKAVPVILYSSSVCEECCLEGMEAGANDYLIIPFSDRQLLARVRAQLQSVAMGDESSDSLRDSEERYRTLAIAFNTAVWRAAPNGDVVGEAHGWEKMTGQTAEEYRGNNWIA